MNYSQTLLSQIENTLFDSLLKELYGANTDVLAYQRKRYYDAICKYIELYGDGDIELYSAPGRTEICGNHTDHQNGMVLAASINLDAIAVVSTSDNEYINFVSEGYDTIRISVNDLTINEAETGTTTALIKGILKGMQNHGYETGAFNAYVTSDVLSGSGLSSSAALESLIGTILSGLYNNMSVSPVEIALIGQYAENVYFGKPCGLMDQIACSVGDFVHIDFTNPTAPIVNRIDFDFRAQGYSLCIVDTKGSHADLTDDYATIPAEMKEVAAHFQKDRLGEVSFSEFISYLPKLYGKLSDRAIIRAYHFFTENARVQDATVYLKANHFKDFLDIVKKSGNSSFKYLQNVYSNKQEHIQPVAIALALSEHFLQENGICRVHGGGFAGTIQVFVKTEHVANYKNMIENLLGAETCHVLSIRKQGGIKVK